MLEDCALMRGLAQACRAGSALLGGGLRQGHTPAAPAGLGAALSPIAIPTIASPCGLDILVVFAAYFLAEPAEQAAPCRGTAWPGSGPIRAGRSETAILIMA
jgi:hypothetical protein